METIGGVIAAVGVVGFFVLCSFVGGVIRRWFMKNTTPEQRATCSRRTRKNMRTVAKWYGIGK